MTALAWHFVGGTLRDGRPVPPDGEWLEYDGPVKICESGLHASERLWDALAYAPGLTLCRVECANIVGRQADKLACRRRRILWRVDAESLLRDFARRCAWQVIDMWDAPDAVRQFLSTGDELLRSAARGAAGDARATASYASWDASDDAREAARHAAGGAVWDAVWHAASGASEDAQNTWLTDAVYRLHWGEYAKWTADQQGGKRWT